MAYGLHIFFSAPAYSETCDNTAGRNVVLCSSNDKPSTANLPPQIHPIPNIAARSLPVVEKMSLKSVLLTDGERVRLVAIRALGPLTPLTVAKFRR
jgi:hypothetical protein